MPELTLPRVRDVLRLSRVHSLPIIGRHLRRRWAESVGASHNGTGTIVIATRAEGNHIVVEIADNGHGIPCEIQARIFDPFFTTKGVGSGTGLGLVVSNRIVADGHGGEIEFESEPGKTVFRVRLPLRLRGSLIRGEAGQDVASIQSTRLT